MNILVSIFRILLGYEYIRITSYDKVVNQIVVHIEDGFSSYDGLNLAGINEADN